MTDYEALELHPGDRIRHLSPQGEISGGLWSDVCVVHGVEHSPDFANIIVVTTNGQHFTPAEIEIITASTGVDTNSTNPSISASDVRRREKLCELLREEYRRGARNELLPRGMEQLLNEYSDFVPISDRRLLIGYSYRQTQESRNEWIFEAIKRLHVQADKSMSDSRKVLLKQWVTAMHVLDQCEQNLRRLQEDPHPYRYGDTELGGYRPIKTNTDQVDSAAEKVENARRILNGLRSRLDEET